MASDPEELLRSIERTREELAHTVDTIAGRLDPKRAAKRGIGALRDGVTSVVDGARAKMHLAADGIAAHTPHLANGHAVNGHSVDGHPVNGHPANGDTATENGTPTAGETSNAGSVTGSVAGAAATTGAALSAKFAKVTPMVRRVPKPAMGVAALAAFAAIVSARRRRR